MRLPKLGSRRRAARAIETAELFNGLAKVVREFTNVNVRHDILHRYDPKPSPKRGVLRFTTPEGMPYAIPFAFYGTTATDVPTFVLPWISTTPIRLTITWEY